VYDKSVLVTAYVEDDTISFEETRVPVSALDV
jgi:hypothetical protein